MNSIQIRDKFLDFFHSHGHTIKPSSPLIPPPDDPTLLFTTAGMVQFKPLWAGEKLIFKRATTVQKCLRAGGKGSDLENVGKTLRHHTFFEMLGNFSFGDYFKKEAIIWAWEFINNVLKMPINNIWVSVYKNDDEAYSIWEKEIHIDKKKIVRLGEKDNFWGPAGVTGACGPSSEIYYDLGESRGCGSDSCRPGCDCERFIEFWNLVFPQFYQNEDGTRKQLERRGIDTGMGLERLAFLLQDEADNNYETDLFKPIVDKIKKFTNIAYESINKQSFHVIADHIRALTFALSENIMPSNEGRGYVLRRLLRRAVRHARKIDIKQPILYKLVDDVVGIMRSPYPELFESSAYVKKIILNEEERFQHTIDYGMYMLEEIINKIIKQKINVISGEDVFKLYDTYGFPVDLINEIVEERSLKIDIAGFERLMTEQKERARISWTGTEKSEIKPVYKQLIEKHGEQQFVGYKLLKLNTEIMAIVAGGKFRDSLNKNESGEVFLKQTPFYAESGGQIGDTGMLVWNGGEAFVEDTQKIISGVISHSVKVKNGVLNIGDKIDAIVDEQRRLSIERHHTATHLLQYALRQIIGDHVKQSGSMVAPNKLRFDFTHFSPLSQEEIFKIENFINENIMDDKPANCYEMRLKEALDKGILAFFGEKYGDTVRVLDIGGYSKELCGGTHVDRTGKIGLFRITGESSVSAGIRRIEAVCGTESLKLINEERQKIGIINNMFKTDPENVITEIKKIMEEYKILLKSKEQSDLDNILSSADAIVNSVKIINNVNIITYALKDVKVEHMRILGDILKDKIKSGIIVLASVKDQKVSLIAVLTKDLVNKGYNAGVIVKQLSSIIGGTGGGKPDMAQAGGKNIEMVDKALEKIYSIIDSK